MNFEFDTFWNSDVKKLEVSAIEFVNALVNSGVCSEAEAIEKVSAFQRESFHQGSLDESFNNCGADA